MTPWSWIPVMTAILLQSPAGQQPPEIIVKSETPAYVVRLPETFYNTEAKEFPRRYVHSCGREPWEKVSAVLVHGDGPLTQNPAGITLEEILPFVTLPP